MSEYPKLPALASDDGTAWMVWCIYCRRFHTHGAGPGHRVAHCSAKDSPYWDKGYILVASDARTKAELKALTEPPTPMALYRVYDDLRVLLYVGISKNFGGRWLQHMREKSWWDEVKYQTVEWFPDESSARAAESVAIHAEQPAWNVAGRSDAETREALKALRQARAGRAS